MVSHDIEFCAKYADRCALFFDGNITSEDIPDKFFKGKNFYTTAACRMAGTVLPDAVIPDDIILALGGKIKKREKNDITLPPVNKKENDKKKEKKISPLRILFGVIFAILFMCFHNGFQIQSAFFTVSLPFILGDIIKCIVASMLGSAMNKVLNADKGKTHF